MCGSAVPGFASPGTFRPRGSSPPRRVTPRTPRGPASRAAAAPGVRQVTTGRVSASPVARGASPPSESGSDGAEHPLALRIKRLRAPCRRRATPPTRGQLLRRGCPPVPIVCPAVWPRPSSFRGVNPFGRPASGRRAPSAAPEGAASSPQPAGLRHQETLQAPPGFDPIRCRHTAWAGSIPPGPKAEASTTRPEVALQPRRTSSSRYFKPRVTLASPGLSFGGLASLLTYCSRLK
jgi:hypothetical protein